MQPKYSIPKSTRKIKALMALKGIKQRDIAKFVGVTDGAIHKVIMCQRTSARIKKEIAKRLGSTPERLWPARQTRRTSK